MKKLAVFWSFVLVACLGAWTHAAGGEAPATEAAVAAAKTWLALVDEGKVPESWRQAAPYFQKAISEEQWLQSMKAFREPLGRVLSRKLATAEVATSLPGAPDGHYVVIRFETSFAQKKNAVETVTSRRCEDGAWRVSGYFIQ